MLLTIQYQTSLQELDVLCDDEGLDLLTETLARLKVSGGHTHLVTPAWAGDELTETGLVEGATLINHLRVVLSRPS